MIGSRIPEKIRRRVRLTAGDRCGYCHSQQKYLLGPLEIEHILPLAAGGSDDEGNLWLACARCNRYKGAQIQAIDPIGEDVTPLYNPRTQRWADHFQWDAEGIVILGLTPQGRATIEALQLNHEHAIAVRRNWVAAGWHPPKE